MNQCIHPPRKANYRPANQEKRAEQILNALMTQTAQVEYDDITVNKLIKEYQRLAITKQPPTD